MGFWKIWQSPTFNHRIIFRLITGFPPLRAKSTFQMIIYPPSAISLPKKRVCVCSVPHCVFWAGVSDHFPFSRPFLLPPTLIWISALAYGDPAIWPYFIYQFFVKANIQQLWSIAELQFSGSRMILIQWRMGTMLLEKKKKSRKEKEKRKGVKKKKHELSLKINEKIGNPRVTAWKKENQYLSQFTWAIQNPWNEQKLWNLLPIPYIFLRMAAIFKNKLAGETGGWVCVYTSGYDVFTCRTTTESNWVQSQAGRSHFF